jgi:glycosyltransferase involved in cell wall biosynthesis
VPEIITHGQNGLLAQPGNIGELAGQIVSFRQDGRLGDRLRSLARASIVERFSVQAQVRQLEAVYEACLNSETCKIVDGTISAS